MIHEIPLEKSVSKKSAIKTRANVNKSPYYPAFAARNSRGFNVGSNETLRNSSILNIITDDSLTNRETLQTLLTKLEKDFELSRKDAASRWSNLDIVVPYDVPRLRASESINKRPSTDLNNSSDSSENKTRHGKFDLREDNIIRENFSKFCIEYSIDNTPLFIRHNNVLSLDKKKNFIYCLAENLPDRNLKSVYERFVRIFTPYVEGKFCKQEDKIIELYMTKPGKKPYVELSIFLNRESDSISRRYKTLQQSKIIDKDKTLLNLPDNVSWNKDIVENVLNNLLQVTASTNIKQLSNATIPMSIWLKVSKEVGIGERKLKDYWDQRLSTQLFAKKPVFRDKTVFKLVNLLYEGKVRYRQEVMWTHLAQKFHGISGLFLWNRLMRLIRTNLPKERHSDFRFCIKHLHKYWCPTVGKFVDLEFQRLTYKDGVLTTKPLKSVNSNPE